MGFLNSLRAMLDTVMGAFGSFREGSKNAMNSVSVLLKTFFGSK